MNPAMLYISACNLFVVMSFWLKFSGIMYKVNANRREAAGVTMVTSLVHFTSVTANCTTL